MSLFTNYMWNISESQCNVHWGYYTLCITSLLASIVWWYLTDYQVGFVCGLRLKWSIESRISLYFRRIRRVALCVRCLRVGKYVHCYVCVCVSWFALISIDINFNLGLFRLISVHWRQKDTLSVEHDKNWCQWSTMTVHAHPACFMHCALVPNYAL